MPTFPLLPPPTIAAASDAASQSVVFQPPPSSPLEPALMLVATIGVALLAVGIIICLYRMLKGPHLADRVLAADMLSIHVLALVVLLAIKFESAIFFDAALVVAILGFASTVAFSQYIYAQRGKDETSGDQSSASTDASDSPPEADHDASHVTPRPEALP
ncbi:MAG: monovalent cation/H+ antiporter complex subunit F [Phycisphaeraceae bacterium]